MVKKFWAKEKSDLIEDFLREGIKFFKSQQLTRTTYAKKLTEYELAYLLLFGTSRITALAVDFELN